MLYRNDAKGSLVFMGAATDQVFSLEDESGTQFHWSVRVARDLAERFCSVERISLSALGVTLELLRRHYPDLDEEYALTTDLTQPVLFVPFRDQIQLIDGFHRLAHACVLGREWMPAYILTLPLADVALLLTLPPGQGIHWGQSLTSDPPPYDQTG